MRYISVKQLSSVLHNWDLFSLADSLKSQKIVCVNCNGENLPIDSMTLSEGILNNARVFRLTINTGSVGATLNSFLNDNESDKENFLLKRTQTTDFQDG